MYGFAYVAATTMVILGVALTVVPVRAMRALNEWYIVLPAIRPGQRLRVAGCRAFGTGFVIGGVALGVSITQVVFGWSDDALRSAR